MLLNPEKNIDLLFSLTEKEFCGDLPSWICSKSRTVTEAQMCIHNGMDAQLFKNLIETAFFFSFNLEINKKYSLTIYINIEMNTNEEEKEKVSFISFLVKIFSFTLFLML